MADLRISDLPALGSSELQAADVLPIADLSASETKKITASNLVLDGITLLADGSIPGAKVNFTTAAGSIGTTELADSSVTAAKLADSSSAVVVTALPATGDFIGQIAIDTSTSEIKSYIWDGTVWSLTSGILNVTGSNSGLVNTEVVISNHAAAVSASIDDTTAAAQFLAGPTGSAGSVSARTIVSNDLPLASAARGAVAVNGNGLALNGEVISIDNTVVANTGTKQLVNYDSKGLVTGGSVITPTDLPVATESAVGVVRPDTTSLSVDSLGEISHVNTIGAGSGIKVEFDENGHVTGSLPLQESDIPNLSTSKIISGTFGASFITDRTVSSEKLSDYSIAYVQEVVPSIATTESHIGMLWLQESTSSLHMWNGNSWYPVSFGRLAQQNLRYAGTIDAGTGLIVGVTPLGISAGYSIGDSLSTATDELAGIYFIVNTSGGGPGSNISVAPGVSFENGDLILCNGLAAGWTRVKASSAGISGITVLNDLLDVTITNPAADSLLKLNGLSSQWEAVTIIDAGTY